MKAVESVAGVEVKVSLDVIHQCPHVDETDHGTLTVTWTTTDTTVELHSLVKAVGTYRDQAISHEEVVRTLADAIGSAGVCDATVHGRFTTAGVSVEVTARVVPRESQHREGA